MPDLIDRRGSHRGDERRAELLEALDDLLREVGSLEAINVAEVSRRAGLTRSAFYFYFENKAFAAAALMEQVYTDAATITDALVHGTGAARDRITAVIEGLFAAVEPHQHLYRAMLEARGSNPMIREFWDAHRISFVEPVAGYIVAEREAGRAPDGPGATTLATVLLDLNDRALEHIARADSLPRTEHLEALVAVWERSIYGTDSPRKATK